MRTSLQNSRVFLARIVCGWALALAVVGMPAWLAADLAAQAPPTKKGKEEVEQPPAKQSKPEEDEPVKQAKPKVLSVDDEEGPAAKPGKQGIPRLEELARDAKNESPAVRKLYESLVPPYDLVHWTYGVLGQAMRVEPFPARIPDEKTKYTGKAKLRHMPEGGGRVIETEYKGVKSIEPFELIAVRRVSDFLAEHKDSKTFGLDYLQAAERVLAAVESFHESAVNRGARVGDGWKEVSDQVRKKLREVQKQELEYYASKNDYDGAFAYATQLSEAYPQPEAHQDFVASMAPFVEEFIKKEKYADALRRMNQINSLFPNSKLSQDINLKLRNVATDFYQKAMEKKKAGDNGEAARLLEMAASISPRHASIQNELRKSQHDYPILNVGVTQVPGRFTPATACTDTELLSLDLLFESLIRPVYTPDIGQRYFPVLAAEHPKLIPLGREFELVRDALWSDGQPVTGVDVRSTLEKLLAEQLGGAAANAGDPLQPVKGARIEGQDSYRVQVQLRRGFYDPLALMAFKVLPYRPEIKPEEFARQPVCSGPFTVKDRQKDEVVFEANNYYQRAARPGLPHIREIHFLQSKQEYAAEFSRENHLHLMLNIPTQDLGNFDSIKRVQTYTLTPRRVYFLAVNCRKPLLQQQDVRRALGLAINREEILDAVFRPKQGANRQGYHRTLTGPFPPGSWAYDPDFKPRQDHQEVAKALAQKEENTLKKTRLSLKYPNGDKRVQAACEEIARQVKNVIDVQLDLVGLPPAQLRDEVEREHNYDLAYYHLDYPDETYCLWPLFDRDATGPGGSNYLGYVNDADLMGKLQGALDYRNFDTVQSHVHEIHRLIYDKMPLIPLWQLDTHIAVHDDLVTVPKEARRLDPLHLFSDVAEWRLAPSR